MKTFRTILFLAIILIIITFPKWITFGNCCTCGVIGWKADFAISNLINNLSPVECGNCAMFGCALSYNIIPVDLFVLITAFAGSFFIKRKSVV